ncbi:MULTISPECIES: DUF4060 family protein [unclassified Serratia (in: enterobacteria)]|uniref:DUF4060 family protein n=1 Tax=unclassified Serratia (in: enterobacteria) TaxID=2647522 RepID=UPI000504C6D9|nr:MULTISPECIES: DUF4060 family protein [unclassified Serratia (in: enterobacteria)]KFK93579.1 hypothetical protein JV45_15665 [Serratia sp. Ag2]KFK93856.1 hypothetical protein IV04_23470 [Serratia sp. Ag1]
MRHIIRGAPSPLERKAAEAALKTHQSRYGNYARSKVTETYHIDVGGVVIAIEIANNKSSYVATSRMRPRSLLRIYGS